MAANLVGFYLQYTQVKRFLAILVTNKVLYDTYTSYCKETIIRIPINFEGFCVSGPCFVYNLLLRDKHNCNLKFTILN